MSKLRQTKAKYASKLLLCGNNKICCVMVDHQMTSFIALHARLLSNPSGAGPSQQATGQNCATKASHWASVVALPAVGPAGMLCIQNLYQVDYAMQHNRMRVHITVHAMAQVCHQPSLNHALPLFARAIRAILCTCNAICLMHPAHPSRLSIPITQRRLLTHPTHAPARRCSRATALPRVQHTR